jgi:hypothetical protein
VLLERKVSKALKVEDHKEPQELKVSKGRDLRAPRAPQHRVTQVTTGLQVPLVELVLKERKVPQELKDFPVHRGRVVLNYQHRLIVIVTVLAWSLLKHIIQIVPQVLVDVSYTTGRYVVSVTSPIIS